MPNDPKVNKVRSLEIPYKALVLRHDPEFEAAKRRDPFYEFTGRTFREDTSKQGPYSSVPNQRDPGA
jgi:hypothetical protein